MYIMFLNFEVTYDRKLSTRTLSCICNIYVSGKSECAQSLSDIYNMLSNVWQHYNCTFISVIIQAGSRKNVSATVQSRKKTNNCNIIYF